MAVKNQKKAKAAPRPVAKKKEPSKKSAAKPVRPSKSPVIERTAPPRTSVKAKPLRSLAKKKPVSVKKAESAPAKAAAVKKPVATPAQSVAVKKPVAAPAKTAEVKKLERPAVAAPAKAIAVKKPEHPTVAAPAKVVEAPPPPQEKPAVRKPGEEERRHKVKIVSREFMVEVAQAIRAAVAPLASEVKGREIIGTAVSGDATFEIDRVAERTLLNFLKNARAPMAYYSEDSGYTTFTNTQPQNLLVVDPIDGTRAAKSGFEACVISIASTRVIERPCMADVDNACVMEILGDRVFYAERGKGARIVQGDHVKRPKLSKNTQLETISWSMTVPARPADLIFPTAAKLIDLSSLKGGFFACNSTAYSLTRLLTNQLDACVDFANRFMRDIPELVKDQFINAGRGIVLGIEPYDLAAGLLIAQEAGCYVTDAYGHSFDDVLLLDTTVENQRSMIAAANKELHEKLLKFFNIRVQQWEELLRRRATRAAAAQAAS